ncbi:hypothetical protein D1007_19356 [Hordeum vulgare]|nr:hypothetical protein D1007_19356 [Hordeum vulgare]
MLRGGLNGMRGFRAGHSPPFLPRIHALFLPAPREKELVSFVFLVFIAMKSPTPSGFRHPQPWPTVSSSKRPSAQKASSQGAWLGSDVGEEHIEVLRHHRLLPPASQVLVRLPGAETGPTPAVGEVVVFTEHFYRGFELPAIAFFAEWLCFFGLQPHHLAPNAILQLSAFVVFCEGFVGIEPRVDLWRSLFFFKQQSIAMEKSEESVKQWQKGFFYVKNADPALDALNMPPFDIDPPTRLNWATKTPKPISEVALICAHLDILEKGGLLGRDLLTTMVACRILPLQRRPHLLYANLQASLRPPAPDVDVSDASEIEDEGMIESRSDSSAGLEKPLESEGTESSGAKGAERPLPTRRLGGRARVPQHLDRLLSGRHRVLQPDSKQAALGDAVALAGGREAEEVEDDTASGAERAGWAAVDAAQRELEMNSKRWWDAAAGKAVVGQSRPSRVEKPVEKRAKARHDPFAHARAEDQASEEASRQAPRAEGGPAFRAGSLGAGGPRNGP